MTPLKRKTWFGIVSLEFIEVNFLVPFAEELKRFQDFIRSRGPISCHTGTAIYLSPRDLITWWWTSWSNNQNMFLSSDAWYLIKGGYYDHCIYQYMMHFNLWNTTLFCSFDVDRMLEPRTMSIFHQAHISCKFF